MNLVMLCFLSAVTYSLRLLLYSAVLQSHTSRMSEAYDLALLDASLANHSCPAFF